MSSDDDPKPVAVTQPPKRGSFGKGLLVGAACVGIAGYAMGAFEAENRYPLREEYELAKTCIDGGNTYLSRSQYLAKQEQCLCALEGVLQKVTYEEYQKAEDKFISAFRNYSAACANKGRR